MENEQLKTLKLPKLKGFFMHFLVKNNILDKYIKCIIKRYDNYNYVNECLKMDFFEIFNRTLNWCRTPQGWNYWANVSYQWKIFLGRYVVPNIWKQEIQLKCDVWETNMDEFELIELKKYGSRKKYK